MDINELTIRVTEIGTDVKWIKEEIKKDHFCKNQDFLHLIMQKSNTNRKLIFIIITGLITSIIGIIVKAIG